MATKKRKNKPGAGRPQIFIDKQQFENLCGLFCTLPEIAHALNCSEDTIERWCKRTYEKNFAEVFKLKKAGGQISIRRKQYEIANAGDKTMLIWLGKQWLGQTDKLEHSADEETIDGIASAMHKLFSK